MPICSQEIPLAAWSVLLNKHLARVPITPNQEATMEMRDKVLLGESAQHMDKSGYQMSDLDVVDFHWENDQLDVDALFRPDIDTPFPQQRLATWRWEDQQRNFLLVRK